MQLDLYIHRVAKMYIYIMGQIYICLVYFIERHHTFLMILMNFNIKKM